MEELKDYTHPHNLSLLESHSQPHKNSPLKWEIYLSLALITHKIALKLVLSQNLEITLVFIDLSQNGKFVNKPKLKK